MADIVSGRASVIDGDTIEIHGERIRILDVDAPESAQTCNRPDGSPWRCGQQSALALSAWIADRTVNCDTDRLDRYGRHLARCEVGGEDVARWLARSGWAVPYRDCKCEVVRDGAAHAKGERLGVWSGNFLWPWVYRQASGGQQTDPAPPTGTCRIKGNINSKGERIYHVPGGRYYEKTKINVAAGERWFCSVGEAIAAGWRAAR